MALLLTEHDVRSLVSMPELIDTVEQALAAYSRGEVDQPVRTVLEVGAEKAFFGTMPCAAPGLEGLGAKLVTVFSGNTARGLPTHLATILLFDFHTGQLQAMVDGRYLTEVRTAAASAVSTRLLAREDARTLAILGSGVQARSHVEALRSVRDFAGIRAWSPTASRLRTFCEECGVRACGSAEEAVRGADVVVLVTSAVEPVIEDAWISPGTHVIGVGACRSWQREMPSALVARARVFVDSRAAALREAGDLLIPMREGLIAETHIVAELGERPRRATPSEVTVFKSLGMAIEDLASAQLVYRRALQQGVGQTFAF
jgi:ornithine cyclodeaminase/alanine dehydrogenase-like protein (mu-crystallin family)